MSGLKWVAVCCAVVLAGSAQAETSKPKNILEYIFGSRKVEEPTSLTPQIPAAVTPPKARAAKENSGKDALAKDKPHPAKAHEAKAKPSIRKTSKNAHAMPIDPVKRAEVSTPTGSYTGPFRGAGNQAYCVRTCDGYFFPINHEGAQGSDRYDTACQTSCPGAKTEVYFMKRGGDIRWSASARGERYSALDNALKYRKERDPACSCKEPEQKWSAILAPVEAMMKHSRNDLVVTEETSQKIAAGEDPMAAVKAAEKNAAAEAKRPGTDTKRADIGSLRKSSSIRSSFGERITPANRFIKIDPTPTGSTEKPAASEKPVPSDKRAANDKPAAIDRQGLQKTLDRLLASNKR